MYEEIVNEYFITSDEGEGFFTQVLNANSHDSTNKIKFKRFWLSIYVSECSY